MSGRWHVPAERLIDEQVLGCRREPVLAAEDVRDRHLVVVDDDGEVIRGVAVGLHEDLILDRVDRPLDPSIDEIVERDDAVIGHLQPYDV